SSRGRGVLRLFLQGSARRPGSIPKSPWRLRPGGYRGEARTQAPPEGRARTERGPSTGELPVEEARPLGRSDAVGRAAGTAPPGKGADLSDKRTASKDPAPARSPDPRSIAPQASPRPRREGP